MGFLTKYLGGWQLYAIIAAAALSAGFYGGMRWEKGANLADAEQKLEQLSIKAQEALVTLGKAWEDEASRAQLEIEEWSLQNQIDQALIAKLIAGQEDIRRQFDDINTEITIADLGTCYFSPDAVELLRAASERANASSMPQD